MLPLCRAGLLWDRGGPDAAPDKKWTYLTGGCGQVGVTPGRYKWGQTIQNNQTELARSIWKLGIEIQPSTALIGPLFRIRVIWTYFGDYWFKLTPKVYLIYMLPLCRAGLLWDRGGGGPRAQTKNGHTSGASVDKKNKIYNYKSC